MHSSGQVFSIPDTPPKATLLISPNVGARTAT